MLLHAAGLPLLRLVPMRLSSDGAPGPEAALPLLRLVPMPLSSDGAPGPEAALPLLRLLASNHLLICCIATVVTADLLHNEGNTSCPLALAAVVAGGIPYGSPLGSCRRGGWD